MNNNKTITIITKKNVQIQKEMGTQPLTQQPQTLTTTWTLQ